MTDELAKRLRGWDHCWPAPWLERAVTEAADRIEQLTAAHEALEQDNHRWKMECENFWRDREKTLTAERDKYASSWMTAEGKLADAEALIEAQAKDHASNNIRFAEAEHRAKTAEAERDQLREALEQFLIEYDEVDLANAEPSSLTEAVLEARAALKGETP